MMLFPKMKSKLQVAFLVQVLWLFFFSSICVCVCVCVVFESPFSCSQNLLDPWKRGRGIQALNEGGFRHRFEGDTWPCLALWILYVFLPNI